MSDRNEGKNRNMNSYSFINPYNFVPLEKKEPDRKPRESEKTYTGMIEYSLFTKTPLVVPNTSSDNAFCSTVPGHKSYDFFSYTDLSEIKESVADRVFQPVIPGSEMRGMIRSNYEILTNSCLSSMDSDTIIGKRTAEVFRAGLLEKKGDDYYVHEANNYCLNLDNPQKSLKTAERANKQILSYKTDLLEEGQEIQFKWEKNKNGRYFVEVIGKGDLTGYVIKGNDGPKKNDEPNESDGPKGNDGAKKNNGPTKYHCHVFKRKNDDSKGELVDLQLLWNVLAAYVNNQKKEKSENKDDQTKKDDLAYSQYCDNLKKFCKGEMICGKRNKFFPVYYSKIELGGKKTIFLSPASITREIYERVIGDMVGKHHTCNTKGALCPACALFGMVKPGKDAFAVASRVRFADLEFQGEKEDAFGSPITLAPLSSPKINNMEFYLERPSKYAVFWTYDYYVDDKGKLNPNYAGINGRKFYWHNMNPQTKSVEQEKMNVTVRPLKGNQTFIGKVYFENISKEELDMLIYTLNCGEWSGAESEEGFEKSEHGYKLGGAKPLGFGSVAMRVKQVLLREMSMNEGKKSVERVQKPYTDYQTPAIEKETADAFSAMTKFDYLKGKNVDYPRIEQGGDIFKWFTKNHSAQRNGKIIKSPNKREQQFYEKYMKPMSPELKTLRV